MDARDAVDAVGKNVIGGNSKSSGNRRSKRAKKRYGTFTVTSLDQFPYRSESLSLDDAEEISRQLGYIPTNLVEVGSYNAGTGKPQTLILYGLNRNDDIKGRYSTGKMQPFPTMVWMSCPELKSQISKLEVDGLVDVFEDRLNRGGGDGDASPARDPPENGPGGEGDKSGGNDTEHISFLDQMHAAHTAYANERWSRLTDEHQAYIDSHGWTANLRDVGVAGIGNFAHVKCLHCHYAHFLARPQHGNVIGAWVHEEMVRRGYVGGGEGGGGTGEGGEIECVDTGV